MCVCLNFILFLSLSGFVGGKTRQDGEVVVGGGSEFFSPPPCWAVLGFSQRDAGSCRQDPWEGQCDGESCSIPVGELGFSPKLGRKSLGVHYFWIHGQGYRRCRVILEELT